MKTLFTVMFTLLLCGCADAQERFDIVDESEVNLRCSCSSSMQNNPFFLVGLKTFKRNDRYPSARNFAE